jgi:hypothetical protein
MPETLTVRTLLLELQALEQDGHGNAPVGFNHLGTDNPVSWINEVVLVGYQDFVVLQERVAGQ